VGLLGWPEWGGCALIRYYYYACMDAWTADAGALAGCMKFLARCKTIPYTAGNGDEMMEISPQT
jgi:hypothetical protein